MAEGSVGQSTWKLKSPEIVNSDGEEIRSSRRDENSEKKIDLDKEGER